MQRCYKFRIYPSKEQQIELNKHLWVSKELWNSLLQKEKELYNTEKKFYSKTQLQKMAKGTPLYSQAAQAVCHRLHAAIFKMAKDRKQGRHTGFPRFRNFQRMRSLYYPQFGFKLNDKLQVFPFGEIPIKQHRQINGKIKTLTIKKSPSGKWFAIFCAEIPVPIQKQHNGSKIGIDLGLLSFATLSNGEKIPNNHFLKKYEQRLAYLQRVFSRKAKGSKNCNKARLKVARMHEKIANARLDFMHKAANYILSNYSLVALEKLHVQKMAMQKYGKSIYDAGWSIFTNILCYKAEEAGSKVVFADPQNTSKECSRCGKIVEKSLHERTHACSFCGFSLDRDINAAINILKRATQGHCGSNACEDGAMALSLKQETKSPAL